MIKELMHLRNIENDILDYAEAHFGEVPEELELKRQTLTEKIKKKSQQFLLYLHSKQFNSTIQYIKDRRKELSKLEKTMERIKGYITSVLSQYIGKEEVPVYDSMGKPLAYAHVEYTVQHKIDIDKVEPEYGTYILPPLTWKQYNFIKTWFLDDHMDGVEAKVQRKVLVSDLPENHPALIKVITPRIRFTKSRRKDV